MADRPTTAPRLAAHAVRAAARPPRSLAARRRDRRHRPRARPRRALERPDRSARTPSRSRSTRCSSRRSPRSTAPEIGAAGRLAVMLHDAPEYVIGDLISPFKALLGGDYRAVEERLLAAIHRRFGLPAPLARQADGEDQGGRPDRRLLRGDAARRLQRGGGAPLSSAGRAASTPAALDLEPWPASVAERRFLKRFAAIAAAAAAEGVTGARGAPYIADRKPSRNPPMPRVHVCPLSQVAATVAASRASHLVSLINDGTPVVRPDIDRRRATTSSSASTTSPSRRTAWSCPAEEHVRELIDFADGWDRERPIVVHCFAGISRSTAAAFITLCAVRPERDEREIARAAARRLALRHAERAARRHRRRHARPRRPHGRRRSPRSAAARWRWRACPSRCALEERA